MLIAQQLKKGNICEYLLYMWQIEDLIRAFNLDIDAIDAHIIQKYPVKDEADRKNMHEWYESLIEMMRLENVQQSGHLQLNKNVIIELNDLHADLLSSNESPAYNAKFIHVLPFIQQLRAKNETEATDIETCFNFQYGIMSLRMKKIEISKETLQAQEEISKFMVLLAQNYQRYKAGEFEKTN